RYDRRTVLLLDQIALVACSAALAVCAFAGDPPVPLLYVLGGVLVRLARVPLMYVRGGLRAGVGAIQNVTRSAIIPNLVRPEKLRSALALNFGLYQVTLVVGPGVGGLLIVSLSTAGVFHVVV